MATVKFNFYNGDGRDHKKLFLDQVRDKCPNYLDRIESLVANDMDLNLADFYTYAMFEDFNENNPGLRSFSGFEQYARGQQTALDMVYELDGSIRFRYGGNTNPQIMHAGCGLALSVSNEFFNLTNADYVRIPEKRGRPPRGAPKGANKRLDFEYWGSDSKRLFSIEAKGMQGLNGDYDAKAQDIMAKKNALPAGNRDLNFGIIGAIPIMPDKSFASCTLVDPIIPDLQVNPLNFRLYARLRYYSDRLSFLARTKWLKQIWEFIDKPESSSEVPRFLDRVEVTAGKSLSFLMNFELKRPLTNPYFFKLTVVEVRGLRLFLRAAESKDGSYFVYGFEQKLFDIIQFGTVKDLLGYKVEPTSIEWKGDISVWDHYLEKDEIAVSGRLYFSSTGEVYGNLIPTVRINE
jgi:hypothetical protein